MWEYLSVIIIDANHFKKKNRWVYMLSSVTVDYEVVLVC